MTLEEERYLTPLNVGVFFSCSPDSCNYRLVKCLSEAAAKNILLNQRICWIISVCPFLSDTGDENAVFSSNNCFQNLKTKQNKNQKIRKKTTTTSLSSLGKIVKIKTEFLKDHKKKKDQYDVSGTKPKYVEP